MVILSRLFVLCFLSLTCFSLTVFAQAPSPSATSNPAPAPTGKPLPCIEEWPNGVISCKAGSCANECTVGVAADGTKTCKCAATPPTSPSPSPTTPQPCSENPDKDDGKGGKECSGAACETERKTGLGLTKKVRGSCLKSIRDRSKCACIGAVVIGR